MLYYKEGFGPITASMRHPGAVLQSQGWRTIDQKQNPRKVRGKELKNKVRHGYVNWVSGTKKKTYFKNERSKLYYFFQGVYRKIINE